MLSQATVLVTGGAGYVGSVLVPRLLEAGHAVRVLDLFLFGEEALRQAAPRGALTCLPGDVRDPALVERAVSGCDEVIHLAAISDEASFDLDPVVGQSVNLRGFSTVLAAAQQAAVRRVTHVAFTDLATESASTARPCDPSSQPPLHPLARCGALVDDLANRARESGLPVTTFRTPTLCGWSPRLRLDLPLNDLIVHAVCLRELAGNLLARCRNGLHVADLASLLTLSLQWPAEYGLGCDFDVSTAIDQNELRQKVTEAFGLENTLAAPAAEYEITRQASAGRLAREFGWRPRRSPVSTVEELGEKLSNGLIPEPLTSPRYRNVEMLRLLTPGELRRAA